MCVCRGDFKVDYITDEESTSIFPLLKRVCLKMADVSYKIHTSKMTIARDLPNGLQPLYKNFVYSRMLWSKSVLLVYRLYM